VSGTQGRSSLARSLERGGWTSVNAGDRTVQVFGTQGRSSVGVWNKPDGKPKAYGLLQGSIRGRGKAAGAHPPPSFKHTESSSRI
jgi:hypothetical protein